MFMTDDELRALSARAERYFESGDPAALNPDDVRRMLAQLGQMQYIEHRHAAQLHHRDSAITQLTERLAECGHRLGQLRAQAAAGEGPQ